MHDRQATDIYLTDQELYEAVIRGELVASPTHLHRAGCSGPDCSGSIIGGSGSRLCGDGVWSRA